MSGGRWPWPPERLAEASAAADELRDMVTAGAETTAQLLARIAELEAEVADWMKCARDGQEMLNTIGRQLGGRIPEQLVSEVARDRMAEIADLIHLHDLIAVRNKSLHK